ncbi:MAG: hypothetical protein ACYCSN_15890 [Acidobacteriaceae bacterium]
MTRQTRPVSWIKAARKEFEKFPAEAQAICLTAQGKRILIAICNKGLGR